MNIYKTKNWKELPCKCTQVHNLEKFHQKNRKLQYRGEMKKKVVDCLNQSKSNWRGQGRSVTPDERKEDTNIRLKHDRGWERNDSREERRIWISGKVCSSKLRNVARRSRAPEGYERIKGGGDWTPKLRGFSSSFLSPVGWRAILGWRSKNEFSTVM